MDEQRGRIAAESEDFAAVLDSLIWCKFLRHAFEDFYQESAQVYTMITGWEMTPQELKRAGERISNLKKLFNIREGWTRADDTLPPRVLQEKLSDGVAAGVGLTREELDYMIGGYYRARGWTGDGLIPESRLMELGLMELGLMELGLDEVFVGPTQRAGADVSPAPTGYRGATDDR